MSDRDLDVVVFGATGVTGRRVAAYLAGRASETELRWGAAARDPQRLAAVLAREGVSAPEPIVADVSDQGSLNAMAARARVVLNLVGPYTTYGRPVIEACVGSGAHYADLTGEMPFVRRVIDEFDGLAADAGVKVVQVCGFEALPPDLATLIAAERARERFDEDLAEVDVSASFKAPPGLPRPSDTISGGTFQSLSTVAGDPDSALITDPAVLIGDAAFAAAVRRTSPITLSPRSGRDGAVIAPMAPAPFINPAVIQRTTALRARDDATIPPFRYREGIALEGGAATLPARWALAGALSSTQVALRGVARANVGVRRRVAGVLSRIGPSSGFGPAAERLEGWRWRMTVDARTQSGRELRVLVDADGHPGYLATARLLGEAGMLLAEDGATPRRSGCLTPAIALGAGSAARFARAGMRISTSD